jgi:hypothetical protein
MNKIANEERLENPKERVLISGGCRKNGHQQAVNKNTPNYSRLKDFWTRIKKHCSKRRETRLD